MMFDKINLYFATCKLRVVGIQDTVSDMQAVFIEIQVNFNKHQLVFQQF